LAPLRVSADGDRLEALAGQVAAPVPLTPAGIAEALAERRIVPSLFMDMFVLGFVEGFALLGGFNQVNYLAWMRVCHERAMLRNGDFPTAAVFARTPTDGLICGPLVIKEQGIESSLDLIWKMNSSPGGRFNGNLDGGLGRDDMDGMMKMSMESIIQRGMGAMQELIE
jgi:hypothetical protein